LLAHIDEYSEDAEAFVARENARSGLVKGRPFARFVEQLPDSAQKLSKCRASEPLLGIPTKIVFSCFCPPEGTQNTRNLLPRLKRTEQPIVSSRMGASPNEEPLLIPTNP
jgi:hypothetical protein